MVFSKGALVLSSIKSRYELGVRFLGDAFILETTLPQIGFGLDGESTVGNQVWFQLKLMCLSIKGCNI